MSSGCKQLLIRSFKLRQDTVNEILHKKAVVLKVGCSTEIIDMQTPSGKLQADFERLYIYNSLMIDQLFLKQTPNLYLNF